MPFQLLLIESKNMDTMRNLGQNVFIDDLKNSYKVYIFYYPGAMTNETLENALEKLGRDSGTNIFVNIGRLNDPKYDKISQTFKIKNNPVIVITGQEEIASVKDNAIACLITAYIKIDNKELLNNVSLTMECIQRTFNLLIQGKIAEALKRSQKDNAFLKNRFDNVFKNIEKFLWEKDIELSILEGKFVTKSVA